MVLLGFHASHEQIGPRQLLEDVQRAERAGFGAALCSDHLNPWGRAQGHSGNAWAWLGAALASTQLRLGVVTAPGHRYPAATFAHQVGTLAAMFPGRFWAAVGTGEYVNESVTGEPWPPKDERRRRVDSTVEDLRRLLAGETVTNRDPLARLEGMRLWDRPDVPPPLLAPAVSPESAAWAARWADGLITLNQPVETLRRVVEAYRGAGGRGPLVLQIHLSWAETDAEAESIAVDQWTTNVISPPATWDLPTPEHFEAATQAVRPEDVRGAVVVSSETGEHVERLREYAALGFEEIYLHHVGQDQRPFIEAFGRDVLPHVADDGVPAPVGEGPGAGGAR
ncbi:TIGR03885 family FMN-dependent LLM class oxidoreductase [Zhihengliuella sp.]|uniref:TIGR03885 family FMN-dependent LLM class oxidoreductase n=1 Tax=Zhihengliuella sp. TaxID=1954483 RepID=UPI00281164C9|nr:TIGR03885 family FMN-dependent LLM class oxidoreductase [Zhihengliuella sp.]